MDDQGFQVEIYTPTGKLDSPNPLETRALLEEILQRGATWWLDIILWWKHPPDSHENRALIMVQNHPDRVAVATYAYCYRRASITKREIITFPRDEPDLVNRIWNQVQDWWRQYLDKDDGGEA